MNSVVDNFKKIQKKTYLEKQLRSVSNTAKGTGVGKRTVHERSVTRLIGTLFFHNHQHSRKLNVL